MWECNSLHAFREPGAGSRVQGSGSGFGCGFRAGLVSPPGSLSDRLRYGLAM